MIEMFYFFLHFYNALDLNNQKILWLPSIFQFERTVHNLNHPKEGRSCAHDNKHGVEMQVREKNSLFKIRGGIPYQKN